MFRFFALVVLLLGFQYTDGKRQCPSNCTISGRFGDPLVIPDGLCTIETGSNCNAAIRFHYHENRYYLSFSTAFVSMYSRFIYALTSNYLSYSISFSCSHSNDCAMEFAKKKVLDLASRNYSSQLVGLELNPFLNEYRQPGNQLVCYDGDRCSGPVCQIEYDTKSKSSRKRGCNFEDIPARVSVYDGGSYSTFDINCNRTACNSPETYIKIKEIFARHNLTDADGRINGVPILTTSFSIVLTLIVAFGFVL